MRHRYIENHCIVIAVYSDIFRNIQLCSDKLKDIKVYWDIFRHYWGKYVEPCSGISKLCVTLAYSQPRGIHNPGIFRTQDNSETCQTSKTNKHIQSPSLVRRVYSSIFKNILEIFRNINPSSATLKHYIIFAKRSILNA